MVQAGCSLLMFFKLRENSCSLHCVRVNMMRAKYTSSSNGSSCAERSVELDTLAPTSAEIPCGLWLCVRSWLRSDRGSSRFVEQNTCNLFAFSLGTLLSLVLVWKFDRVASQTKARYHMRGLRNRSSHSIECRPSIIVLRLCLSWDMSSSPFVK